MKKTDGESNGNNEAIRNAFTTQVIEENPYLQKRPAERGEVEDSGLDEVAFDSIIGDEDGAPVEPEALLGKVHSRRRRIVLVGLATLFLMALVLGVALYRRMPTRVDYGRTKSQGEVLPPAPNINANSSRDSRTEKAIEEARRLTGREAQNDSVSATKSDAAKAAPDSKRILEDPFKFPATNEGAINAEKEVGGSSSSTAKTSGSETKSEPNSTVSVNQPNVIRSQRSSETSLYMNQPVTDRVVNSSSIDNSPKAKTLAPVENRQPISLPAFASMLPVRTLGALYTLRTGALVRFELTRETKGDGWLLRRGTILVGSTKGGDLDRAYVNLIGFIDPQSGKLVKLSGDLLGSDGGAGLKGKRRQLDGGWSRALGRLASSALDVTGAFLSGHGGDTVVISDGLRTRTINPVTDEISGALGTELNGRQDRSFVEVLAGTPGYVLVTDLPVAVEGKEPTPSMNGESLAALTDIDALRPATGLSERELADLLSNGSPDQIRQAMPRMSPEMRRIAETVVRPKDR